MRGLRGARLEGSHPNTEIVVSCLNLNTGKEEESRWPV
jgi:hypothetical protein